jgi:hypothetical protein
MIRVNNSVCVLLFFLCFASHIYGQIPLNTISVKFENSQDKDSIEVSGGYIYKNIATDSITIVKETLIEEDNFLIRFSYNKEKNEIFYSFSPNKTKLIFFSLRRGNEEMNLYFAVDENDNGYKFQIGNVKFKSKTYYLDLRSNSKILSNYKEQTFKYKINKEEGILITNKDFKKCKISNKSFPADNLRRYKENKNIEKSKLVKIMLFLFYNDTIKRNK